MWDEDETERHCRSLIDGVSRGALIGLGVALAEDASAAGEATGLWRLDLPHCDLLPALIITLLLLAVVLQLRVERGRLVDAKSKV